MKIEARYLVSESDKNAYKAIQKMIETSSLKANSNEFAIGYSVMGPMLVGYAKWLNESVKKEKIERIFFLAREGKILKQVYEILFGNEIETQYIHVSRLAVARAQIITTTSYDEMIDIIRTLMRWVINVEDLLRLFELDTTDTISKILQEGITENKKLCDLNEEEKKKIYSVIMQLGKGYFEEQHDLLMQYLQKRNFGTKKVAIADVGWNGTMQVLLQRSFPESHIIGFYFGVLNMFKKSEYDLSDRRGFYFQNDHNFEFCQMIRFSLGAFENLFFCSEGSTLKYFNDGNEVKPVMEKNEQKEAIKRGLEKIIDGLLDFTKDYKNCDLEITLSPSVCFLNYIKFAVYPSMRTMQVYKDMTVLDGLGEHSLLPSHSLIYFIAHCKKLYREFENSTSKILWMKELFKIPLPYFQILCLLTGKFRIKTSYRKLFN